MVKMKRCIILGLVLCALVFFGIFGIWVLTAKTVYANTEYNNFDQNLSIKNNEYVVINAPATTTDCQYVVEDNAKGVTLELNPTGGALNMDASGTEHSCIYLKSGSEASVIINGEVNMKSGHYRGTGQDKGYAAIAVNTNAKLTLIVNGKLTAYGGDGGENRGAAAIGGGDEADSGLMVIKVNDGGELYCEGGDGGAAIGGGDAYSANKSIYIETYGTGKLTAKATTRGSGGGAGIGGGDGGSANSTIDITMYDSSTIYAEGISGGAGIGGGGGNGSGKITINMNGTGTLTAVGGDSAAAIGGGKGGSTGDICINGHGTIDATAGFAGAAIGGGDAGGCGNITIKGDGNYQNVDVSDYRYGTFDGKKFALNITARASQDDKSVSAYYGPNIGGKKTGNISIENADIYCVYPRYAAMYAASIGCGFEGSVNDITVRFSRLRQNSLAYGNYNCYGAMIGEGYGGDVNTINLDAVWCYGRSIGGSAWDAGNIDTINIKNSYVYADAAETSYIVSSDKLKFSDPIAGIGSGKDASVGNINITDSDIHAFGKCGGAGIGTAGFYVGGTNIDNIFKTGGKCGNITISGSTVEARGANGGAGIGGGTLTSVTGTIKIYSSKVDATTVNSSYNSACGAGIGGGTCAGCKDILISYSTVNATSGKFSAGIGSGGVCDANFFGGIVESAWDAEVGSIEITGSEVTAQGGDYGAGIGNGWGSQQTSGKHINIKDSVVTAHGGKSAAGIGGGNNSEFERGGDISNINITGRSRVEAYGGDEGAGIGGGSQGELHGCTIELDEMLDADMEGKLAPLYYVKAWGGTAAAGIGSGPSHAADISGMFEGAHIATDITIKSGFVYAKGGGDKKLSNINGDYWIGSGAGIGGGGRGGLKNFVMSGGVVIAEHQSATVQKGLEAQTRQPSDIGHGGGYAPWAYSDTDCSGFTISGGTVDAGICDQSTIKVTGGSLRDSRGGDHPSDPKAKNESGANVYKNTINLDPENSLGMPLEFAGHTFYGLSVWDVSSEYGTNGIYGRKVSDTRAQIWLHLPESAENQACATVGENVPHKYYGTTRSGDNTNILRIGSEIVLEPEYQGDLPAANRPFKLYVKPAENCGIPEGTVFTYSVSGSSNPQITEQEGSGTAPYVVVTPSGTGDLTVTASGDGQTNDIYWASGSAQYQSEVLGNKVQVTIARDLSKLYDGKDSALSVLTSIDQDPSYTPDILVDPEAARGEYNHNLSVKYTNLDAPGMKVLGVVEPGNYLATVTCMDSDSADGSITIDGVTYAPGTATQNFTVRKYTQAFEVTSPEQTVFVPKGGKAEIKPEWTLNVTDLDEAGNPVVPVVNYQHIQNKDDKGYVTVQYRDLNDPQQTLTDEAPTDPGHYQMVLSASESEHYYKTEETYDFEISETLDTQLSLEAENKIYDGEAYGDLQIISNRDQNEFSVSYYRIQETGEPTLLDGAPADAGKYKAVVSAEETIQYTAASAEAEFEITPRTVTLSITAKENEDGSCNVRVEVGNGIENLVGKDLTLSVKAGEDTSSWQEPIFADGISYAATHYFAQVPEGDYAVSADFNADGAYANYDPASDSVDLRMNGSYQISADSMELVYGGEAKSLAFTVTDSTGASFDPAGLNMSFASSDTNVAAVDSNGVVSPVHPGICKVTVTAGADDMHKEGSGTAVITVHKGEFRPRVVVEDKTYDGEGVTPQLFDVPEDYQGLEAEPVYFYYVKNGSRYDYLGDSEVEQVVIRDAGEYMVLVVCTRDRNYKHEEAVDSFTISPAPVSVKTGSAEKVYDGTALTCEEAELSGLIPGETATIQATGSQTEIGSSDNKYQITWAGNGASETAKSKNYTLTKEEIGTLTVKPENEGPFEIWTYQDLEKMANDVAEHPEIYAGATYKVMCNIKAPADSSWTKGIGSVSGNIPFTGTLEGNGYCIAGMNINMPEYGGLFEWIGEGGAVQNLYLFDCDYAEASAVGGGIAAVNDGTISYCVNGMNAATGVYVDPKTGNLIPMKEFNSVISGEDIGGIAGENNGTIFACRSVAEMTGTDDNAAVGGIAGRNSGTIDNCAGNNMITASGRAASASYGGICGENYGSVAGGYSSAMVRGAVTVNSGNVAGFGNNASLADIYFTTSEGQQYQGGGTNKLETNVVGMARGEMMVDSFLDLLKGTASNKVSWIRSNGYNAGLPRIENPSAAFYQKTLSSGSVRVSALLHQGANLEAAELDPKSEVWKLLAEAAGRRVIESAVGITLTDDSGNPIPSEFWAQSEEEITVPVSRKDVCIVLLDEDGEAKIAETVKVVRDGSQYLATVKTGGAAALMVARETRTIKASDVTLAAQKVTYNGKAQKPAVTVKYGTEKLIEGTDYTVTYRNNKNAGTAEAVVTGKGCCTGTVTKKFTIAKAKNEFTNVTSSVKTMAGKTFQIKADVKENAALTYSLLTSSAEQKFKVAKNGTVTVNRSVKKGQYKIQVLITAKATGNYQKTEVRKTIQIQVQAPKTTPLKASYVTLAKQKVTYNGKVWKPAVTVKYGKTKLKVGTDYKVAYRNNLKAGVADVIVTGIGKYSGTVTKHFTIVKAENKITNVTSAVKTKAGAAFRIKASVKENAALTYKLLTSSAEQKFKVAKNGTVTVNKGVKKGQYKIQVQITAKETGNYKKAVVKKTITITVR
ncbi:MAG: hypothetical protein IKF90_10720 [Parasporobacterium sp.]|nr:hypothetical protein [Parasporobacterium sp.]